MKFYISKEWCLTAAELEAGANTLGAGILAMNPGPGEMASAPSSEGDEARIAFGQFVTLARRQRRLAIEALAKAADLDIGELLAIEQHDPHFAPEPRTVYQLANFFGVSRARLMELAGLTRPKNTAFVEQAIKFAARSASVAELNKEEQAVLEGLIKVLSEQDSR